MNRNFICALLLLVPQMAPATMPRNPFQPLVSPCDALIRQLDRWTLHGVISSNNGSIAVMRDPQKSWRRFTPDTEPEPGAFIEEINPQALSVRLPPDCEQSLYLWQLKGTKHGMDAGDNSTDGVATP